MKLHDDAPTPAEWLKMNYFTEIVAFQHRLSIHFNDQSVLLSAFAHPSFIDDLKDVDTVQVIRYSSITTVNDPGLPGSKGKCINSDQLEGLIQTLER